MSIEGTPLGLIAARVAELARAHGAIREADLAHAYASHFDVDVPGLWQRTLKRFAWTGKALRYLELDGDVWRPGSVTPHPDPRYGDWTFRAIVERADELLDYDDDPFETLLAEVYSGTRTPRLAMSLVGSAINQARRERQLPM